MACDTRAPANDERWLVILEHANDGRWLVILEHANDGRWLVILEHANDGQVACDTRACK